MVATAVQKNNKSTLAKANLCVSLLSAISVITRRKGIPIQPSEIVCPKKVFSTVGLSLIRD